MTLTLKAFVYLDMKVYSRVLFVDKGLFVNLRKYLKTKAYASLYNFTGFEFGLSGLRWMVYNTCLKQCLIFMLLTFGFIHYHLIRFFKTYHLFSKNYFENIINRKTVSLSKNTSSIWYIQIEYANIQNKW